MAAPRNRQHIIVPGEPKAEPYRPHPRRIDRPKPRSPESRIAHGKALKKALQAAVVEAHERRTRANVTVDGAVPGLYVQFDSRPGDALALSSFEARRQGIELVAVTEEGPPEARTERATVFVPDEKVQYFLRRFEAYSRKAPRAEGEQRYEKMLDPVASLRLGTLRSLWTDVAELFPQNHKEIWWEVWLRRHDDQEVKRLLAFARAKRLNVARRRIQFEDRIVMLVRATPEQLSSSIDVLGDLAEVRLAKEPASFFAAMGSAEQADWAKDLLARTTTAGADAPAVCLLDTGVTQGHPLLRGALEPADCLSCDPKWGTHDHDGHGTEMAGLALFGDLTPLLAGREPVQLRHRLESVKLLPPTGTNRPDLYGAITGMAASTIETLGRQRWRCFSMAVTATEERDRGQPTSWSAAVDALAAGRDFDPSDQGLNYLDGESTRRLFVISAGNVPEDGLQLNHIDRSDADGIHDPGQAWNALTVGAFTDKALIEDPEWAGWQPLASKGDLSPWSTTGVTFGGLWPNKPDIVLEGGNVARNGKGEIDFPCADLSLLSLSHRPTDCTFVLSWATSAATAQAARMAAIIAAEYPTLSSEAVRALIVHSARWTPRMQASVNQARRKRDRANLLRRYGYGVPSRERALRSAADSLTLIAQSSIRPFREGKMREMHLFTLPWPHDELLALGETIVQLRVTLSYFIEPNPGRRGWVARYRYPSHGLRFEIKGATESLRDFRARLNGRALTDDEPRSAPSKGESGWFLGERRNRGSIHSDFLRCSAADLAERGVVGVYPVTGWWKEQPTRDRSKLGAPYAIVISIEAPGVETDIWTPVAQHVGLMVPVDT